MTAYDHATKAGNAGDLHKHAVLSAVAHGIRVRRPGGLCFVDAYSGLKSEYLVQPDDPRTELLERLTRHLSEGGHYPPCLDPWLSLLRQSQQADPSILYPGSSGLLRYCLHSRDSLCLNDQASTATDPIVFPASWLSSPIQVHGTSMTALSLIGGWSSDWLAPDLLFMDPSYTGFWDRQDLVQVVRASLIKWPNACVVYWSRGGSLDHPVVSWAPARDRAVTVYSLNGSSTYMGIFNPPAKLEKDLLEVMEFLTDVLGGGRTVAFCRLEHTPKGH